jgi:hypothetical protein
MAGGDLDNPGRTENYETYSLHWRPGESESYKRHKQNTWSGVYIGFDNLTSYLLEANVEVIKVYYHNPKKLRAIWVIGRKIKRYAT